MKYRRRIYYTEKQKALMWDRWGSSLRPVAFGPGLAADCG